MLDSIVKTYTDPHLNKLGKILSNLGITAIQMTLIGFLFGVISIVLISIGKPNIGVIFLIMSRLCDGLDGAIARHTKITDFGGFLDIVCDFIIYSGVVFAFGIMNSSFLIYSLILLFSFIGPITSFLAYAIIAAKHKINHEKCGKKSFYYLSGLCEGTETILTLILMCLFPYYFPFIAIIYAGMCIITTISRVYMARRDFL